MPDDPSVDLIAIYRADHIASARRDEDRIRARGWPIIVNALDWSGFNASPNEQIDSWLDEHTTAFERTGSAVGFNDEAEAFAFKVRFG